MQLLLFLFSLSLGYDPNQLRRVEQLMAFRQFWNAYQELTNIISQEQGKIENNLYRLTDKLESLPEVPAGRRLMILNEKMEAVYDSQNPKDYKPVEKGYISFI